jgi:hypothetical protein
LRDELLPYFQPYRQQQPPEGSTVVNIESILCLPDGYSTATKIDEGAVARQAQARPPEDDEEEINMTFTLGSRVGAPCPFVVTVTEVHSVVVAE